MAESACFPVEGTLATTSCDQPAGACESAWRVQDYEPSLPETWSINEESDPVAPSLLRR